MSNIIPVEKIENKILLIRGLKVMLDRDLAELYGVETKVLNQAIKRNKKRFPDDFMFQLTRMETEYLVSQNVIPLRSQIVTLKAEKAKNKGKTTNLRSQIVTSRWGGSRYLPYVFTEQGVAMLSSVLKSERAIEMNIIIMRAFVKIRNLIYSYKDLAEKVEKMERTYNKQIGKIFEMLDKLTKTENNSNKAEIGFKG
ncbi:ORF6N domain-containing protein [Patescibacteria group bacterium]|nr:ORF6N domain-containing protein [Patescibacteria group bacterium]